MSEKTKTVTMQLREPVTVDGVTYKELTFRRMKAKDALLSEDEGNKIIAGYRLFAALAGVDLAVIEELDIDDLEELSEKLVPLMGKSAAAEAEKQKAAAANRPASAT